MKDCEFCGEAFSVYASHTERMKCCSRECSNQRRAAQMRGESNPNWAGGQSRLPYPWNFREISRQVIERDGCKCQNPKCAGTDPRLTTHHINYTKSDCRQENLICLCSACNSKANFGRETWAAFYQALMSCKKDGGGRAMETF
jgi:5-methylcytosine-specific restriction endonuclease McrA